GLHRALAGAEGGREGGVQNWVLEQSLGDVADPVLADLAEPATEAMLVVLVQIFFALAEAVVELVEPLVVTPGFGQNAPFGFSQRWKYRYAFDDLFTTLPHRSARRGYVSACHRAFAWGF